MELMTHLYVAPRLRMRELYLHFHIRLHDVVLSEANEHIYLCFAAAYGGQSYVISVKVKVKVKSSLCFNRAPCHEGVLE